MNQAQQMLHNMFEAYKHSSDYKDSVMMEIMTNKAKFEKNLDDMWALIPRVGMSQITEYKKGVEQIKSCGLIVLRNGAGKHKIDFRK